MRYLSDRFSFLKCQFSQEWMRRRSWGHCCSTTYLFGGPDFFLAAVLLLLLLFLIDPPNYDNFLYKKSASFHLEGEPCSTQHSKVWKNVNICTHVGILGKYCIIKTHENFLYKVPGSGPINCTIIFYLENTVPWLIILCSGLWFN